MTRSSEVAERIVGLLREQPRVFYEILRALEDVEYRAILEAWGAVRERGLLDRDPDGRYRLRGEAPAAARGRE